MLLICLAGLACSGPPAAAPGEWREFEGTWTATGTRRTLRLEPGRQASIFDLSGSLLLTGKRGLGVGFRAEVIGLADTQSGGAGRAVWTDERGDQVFRGADDGILSPRLPGTRHPVAAPGRALNGHRKAYHRRESMTDATPKS